VNPLPKYFELLYNAYDTSEAQDLFDVNSADPGSRQAHKFLVRLSEAAQVELIKFVLACGPELIERMEPTE
jgi:hypothetical protein